MMVYYLFILSRLNPIWYGGNWFLFYYTDKVLSVGISRYIHSCSLTLCIRTAFQEKVNCYSGKILFYWLVNDKQLLLIYGYENYFLNIVIQLNIRSTLWWKEKKNYYRSPYCVVKIIMCLYLYVARTNNISNLIYRDKMKRKFNKLDTLYFYWNFFNKYFIYLLNLFRLV